MINFKIVYHNDRCPVCNSRFLTRKKRKLWMKLFFNSRFYACTMCSTNYGLKIHKLLIYNPKEYAKGPRAEPQFTQPFFPDNNRKSSRKLMKLKIALLSLIDKDNRELNTNEYKIFSIDISSVGIGLKCNKMLPQGSILKCKTSEPSFQFSASLRVLHTNKPDNYYVSGCEIIN